MANLAASAVARYPSNGSRDYYPRQDQTLVSRSFKLTLSSQGTLTNQITASALGFSTLRSVSNLWDADNGNILSAVIDPVNNIVLLQSNSYAPIDVATTSGYITVVGDPKPTT